MPEPTNDSIELDIEKSVADISRDLGLGQSEEEHARDAEDGGPEDAGEPPASEGAAAPASAPADSPIPPPSSWAKEKHELWAKLPRDAQDYYTLREKQFLSGLEQYKGDAAYAKQLREVVTPYIPTLQAQGISETDAVRYLLNAHHKLTSGTDAERMAAYEQIGRDLGFVADSADPASRPPAEVLALRDRLNRVESALTARQQAEIQEAQRRAQSEVQAFASDPKHTYFDEVAPDMVAFIKSGHSIQDAYDRAVYANPVTRAKEIARLQTEANAQSQAKQQDRAQAAKQAAAANVRSAEARRPPSEPVGKFLSDEAMREDLRRIRSRTT